jgi:ribulose-5-phosphate 4-epimerase/fuculose-1-phosphate aldolase
VEQACVLAVQLEKTAEMQLRVAQIGEVSLLTPEDFGWDFVLSDDYYLPTWAYLCSK